MRLVVLVLLAICLPCSFSMIHDFAGAQIASNELNWFLIGMFSDPQSYLELNGTCVLLVFSFGFTNPAF
jgi:hypothetical protein